MCTLPKALSILFPSLLPHTTEVSIIIPISYREQWGNLAPSLAICKLCDLRKVPLPFWALISPSAQRRSSKVLPALSSGPLSSLRKTALVLPSAQQFLLPPNSFFLRQGEPAHLHTKEIGTRELPEATKLGPVPVASFCLSKHQSVTSLNGSQIGQWFLVELKKKTHKKTWWVICWN